MKKVLVAVDLMDETSYILDVAKKMVKIFTGELIIVHSESIEHYLASDEFGAYPTMEIPHMIELRKKSIEERLSQIKKEIENENIAATTILLDGPTVENILKEAEEFKVDLIIVGSHKHGRFYKILFGSIHDMLVQKSNIPVLIVPPNPSK